MISDKKTNRVWHNPTTERVMVTIHSINCDRTLIDSVQVLHGVFKAIADDPRLLECGESKVFENANISHDGTKWVIKMEAYVPRV